jgi:hypothetical protein
MHGAACAGMKAAPKTKLSHALTRQESFIMDPFLT